MLCIDSAIEVAQTHLPAGRENGCKIPGKGQECDEDLFGTQQAHGARQVLTGGIPIPVLTRCWSLAAAPRSRSRTRRFQHSFISVTGQA